MSDEELKQLESLMHFDMQIVREMQKLGWSISDALKWLRLRNRPQGIGTPGYNYARTPEREY